jgi:Zn-dependent protease
VILFFSNFWFLLRELARAPFDILTGAKRRRYTIELGVDAPKSVTWSVASAHSIRLDGTPPIEIATTPDHQRTGVHSGVFKIGEREFPIAYRVIDERAGEAMLIEIIKEESAPECCPGDNYVCAFAVAGDGPASTITSTFEVTHTKLSSRFLLPLAAVQNSLRLKRNAELRAGSKQDDLSSQIKNAAITGALTFASFFAMFGPSAAAMLIVLILIHELGHVIAMRWAGIPVKGIYFIPFFGGVAVGGDRYKSEVERGIVALMGPGLSLLTTAIFGVLAGQSGDPMMRELAFMSALLNGFNLLPIQPLDGGQIMQSLLSRLDPGVARVFHTIALLAGGAIALYLGSLVLLMVLLLAAPAIASKGSASRRRISPIALWELAVLLAAYTATIVFYLTILAGVSGDAAPPQEFN